MPAMMRFSKHEKERKKERKQKEVVRRVTLPMSDQNKIKAINTFAIPILIYFMPVIYFCQEDLKDRFED